MNKKSILITLLSLIIMTLIVGCSTTESVSSTPRTAYQYTETPLSKSEPITVSWRDQSLLIKNYYSTVQIQVFNVIRGGSANLLIEKTNMFNPKPDPGFEYLLVMVRETYIQGDSSISANPFDFKVYVEGTGYSPEFAVLPEEMRDFESVSLLPGGKTDGYIVFMVPIGKQAKLAYEEIFEPVGFIDLS